MTALHWDDLATLLEPRLGPCVSLTMPTHRSGRDVQQDPIRLKNLLRQAESELERVAIRGTSAKEILAPARNLLQEPEFWEHGSDGLAAFLAPDFARFYRVPAAFGELAVVSGAFHLKPLLPLLSGDGQFYVLALSQNEVRLFEGTRYSVTQLDPKGMPRSLEEALLLDDPQRVLQHHGGSQGGGGRRSGIHHGHGGASETEKTDLHKYFRRIDDALVDYLGAQHSPLVLAGVDYYFPIFRDASRYSNLLGDGVGGNPEEVSVQQLHERAWALVEPLFQKAEEAALARYRGLAGQGKTSDGVPEILPAAHHGRVDTLFIALGETRWGSYIPAGAGSVVQHAEYEPGDRDLLDVAATWTIRNGGRVHALDAARIPSQDSAVAAIFRY